MNQKQFRKIVEDRALAITKNYKLALSDELKGIEMTEHSVAVFSATVSVAALNVIDVTLELLSMPENNGRAEFIRVLKNKLTIEENKES